MALNLHSLTSGWQVLAQGNNSIKVCFQTLQNMSLHMFANLGMQNTFYWEFCIFHVKLKHVWKSLWLCFKQLFTALGLQNIWTKYSLLVAHLSVLVVAKCWLHVHFEESIYKIQKTNSHKKYLGFEHQNTPLSGFVFFTFDHKTLCSCGVHCLV